MKAVAEVVKLLKSDPTLHLSVEGHTDNVGSASSNQKLSEERAHSVMTALVAQGVDAKRLTFKGFGASHPVSDNATEAGKAENRRVELVKPKS
jgi:outer membrane protein OmpA-like peptidoglycan-associated protein